MRTEKFDREVATLRLVFTCEECANFHVASDRCGHGWPTHLHRRERYRQPGRPRRRFLQGVRSPLAGEVAEVAIGWGRRYLLTVGLFRWAFWLLSTIAIGYFSAMVPLGRKTLLGHLRAIGSTKEAQELVDGTKAAAGKAASHLFHRDGAVPPEPPSPPSEKLGDRKALHKPVKEKARTRPSPTEE